MYRKAADQGGMSGTGPIIYRLPCEEFFCEVAGRLRELAGRYREYDAVIGRIKDREDIADEESQCCIEFVNSTLEDLRSMNEACLMFYRAVSSAENMIRNKLNYSRGRIQQEVVEELGGEYASGYFDWPDEKLRAFDDRVTEKTPPEIGIHQYRNSMSFAGLLDLYNDDNLSFLIKNDYLTSKTLEELAGSMERGLIERREDPLLRSDLMRMSMEQYDRIVDLIESEFRELQDKKQK